MGSHWKGGGARPYRTGWEMLSSDVLEVITAERLLRDLKPKSDMIRGFRKIIGAGMGVIQPLCYSCLMPQIIASQR